MQVIDFLVDALLDDATLCFKQIQKRDAGSGVGNGNGRRPVVEQGHGHIDAGNQSLATTEALVPTEIHTDIRQSPGIGKPGIGMGDLDGLGGFRNIKSQQACPVHQVFFIRNG